MREVELAAAYDQVILPFWQKNGQARAFYSALDGSPDAQQEFCDRLERIAGAWHELFVKADADRQPALALILGFIWGCVG